MGLLAFVKRFRVRTRTPVAPSEIGRDTPFNEWPDTTAADNTAMKREADRRTEAFYGRQTAKKPKGNRP